MSKQYQLPREFAEKWMKALRSGEYKQGSGYLGSVKRGYCCVAVAGLLCGLTDDNYKGAKILTRQGDFRLVGVTDEMYMSIPLPLRGTAKENELIKELTELNDVRNKSFSEIADWIEQNVEFV